MKHVAEGVVPDVYHVVPVGHNTMFNRIIQGKETLLGLRFFTNKAVFLINA
jgi:hypothetical protein